MTRTDRAVGGDVPANVPAEKILRSRPAPSDPSSPASRVAWPTVAMDDTTTPIQRLSAHLTERSRGPAGRAALARWEAAGLDPGEATTPVELALSCHGRGNPGRSGSVVAELVRLAPVDETAALCALVALRPALLRLAGHLVRRGTAREEAECDVVAVAWEQLGVLGGVRRRYAAADVVDATWSRLRTLTGLRLRRTAWEPLGPQHDAVEAGADPAERVTTVLTEAVADGTLSARQAAVVHDTRVLDRPVAEVAARSGRDPRAVRTERSRAEATLRRHLSAEGAGS